MICPSLFSLDELLCNIPTKSKIKNITSWQSLAGEKKKKKSPNVTRIALFSLTRKDTVLWSGFFPNRISEIPIHIKILS